MNHHPFIYLFISLVSIVGLLLAFVFGIEMGLSISHEKYENTILPVLSMFGTWVGAFATCSAVLVSLWLAFKQLSQDKEILDCHLNMDIIAGYQDTPCIGLRVVSKGNKPSNILSLSWYGESAESAMIVTRFHEHSENLPRFLSYGEQLRILHIPNFEKDLKEYVLQYMNGSFKNLFLMVNTTTESKKIKVDSDMLRLIESS